VTLDSLLAVLPFGLVVLAGLGLSVRNFRRHGRSARVALVGYLLAAVWVWMVVAVFCLWRVVPRTSFWGNMHSSLGPVFQLIDHVVLPAGYALLTWAVFAGRRPAAGGRA
jgi:hypothetical protein